MKAHLYIEGGGPSKWDKIGCREGFRKLLQKAGFSDRPPALTACGGREAAFDRFKTAHKTAKGAYVAMLVDSEDPIANVEKTWEHLKTRPDDNWDRPIGASDDQVLLMTTCMESWIVADRATLKGHYGQHLQETALPPLHNLENRDRHDVQDKLGHATRNCSNAYAKGKRSFEILGILDPKALENLLSFARMVRILKEKL